MSDEDNARQQFREALELNKQLEKGDADLLPPKIALAKCWEWINQKAATTGSAKTLRSFLLSLADQGTADLSYLRALDPERRLWLASIIVGLTFIQDTELLSAAGGLENERLSGGNPPH
jgi:hypothetical protein